MNKIENKDIIINHWVESSEDDKRTMRAMYSAKSYNCALFVGHIAIEKLLKGLYVKKNDKNPPFTHNLYRLAEQCDIDLTNDLADKLDYITSFNIESRYDDYKKEFYQLCTKDFTEKWIKVIEDILLWIKKQY
jgi:HEPN domain-containing protein